VFWRRRALQDQYRYILPITEKYSADLIADKGGDDNVSAAEKRMIEIAQTRACRMLILAEGHKRGLIRNIDDNDWDLTQGFKELNRYLKTERQALRDLGLERRQKVKTLAELLSEEAAEDDSAENDDDNEQS
jgi:hypothetical protein